MTGDRGMKSISHRGHQAQAQQGVTTDLTGRPQPNAVEGTGHTPRTAVGRAEPPRRRWAVSHTRRTGLHTTRQGQPGWDPRDTQASLRTGLPSTNQEWGSAGAASRAALQDTPHTHRLQGSREHTQPLREQEQGSGCPGPPCCEAPPLARWGGSRGCLCSSLCGRILLITEAPDAHREGRLKPEMPRLSRR